MTPSSSTRTLFVPDSSPPHALKVHFPFRISRYGRRMRDEVVEQAVTVSRELQEFAPALDHDFGFLREVLGITAREEGTSSQRGENWGYLIRDLRPFPLGKPGTSLIPGFALYGHDYFHPETPLLLYDLVGEGDPLSFVMEEIMFPVIRHWVACFRRLGFLLEPHGQNVLLEAEEDGTLTRIVYRDLNLGVDNRRRRDLGLPVSRTNTYNQMETGEFASITYDKFMGGHFFDPLGEALGNFVPTLVPEDLREPCRQEFARAFPDHRRYLPRTVHYFSEERDRFGKPLFQDTGVDPVWRP